MAGMGHTRDTARMALMAVMAVTLPGTLLIGTGSLIWNGAPTGDTLTFVAGVFAWIFAAAFLLTLAIALFEEHDIRRHRPPGYIAKPREH